MKDEGDYHFNGVHIGRLAVGVILGIMAVVVAIVIAIIVLRVVVNAIPAQGTSWWGAFWDVLGLLIFLWMIGWVFRFAFAPWGRWWGRSHHDWHGGHGRHHAMRILRRRYASGEISSAEFKRKANGISIKSKILLEFPTYY